MLRDSALAGDVTDASAEAKRVQSTVAAPLATGLGIPSVTSCVALRCGEEPLPPPCSSSSSSSSRFFVSGGSVSRFLMSESSSAPEPSLQAQPNQPGTAINHGDTIMRRELTGQVW